MQYNREKAEIETLENHREFYKNTIKRICEGDFVLSSINTLNHITSLQNKIEVYINAEKKINKGHNFNHLLDATEADRWLSEKFHALLDSGTLFKQLQK